MTFGVNYFPGKRLKLAARTEHFFGLVVLERFQVVGSIQRVRMSKAIRQNGEVVGQFLAKINLEGHALSLNDILVLVIGKTKVDFRMGMRWQWQFGRSFYIKNKIFNITLETIKQKPTPSIMRDLGSISISAKNETAGSRLSMCWRRMS